MIINLKLSDELFEFYVKKYGLPKAYAVMKRALEAMKEVDDNEPYLFIVGEDRLTLQNIFQTTLDSPKKLITLVKNLIAVRVGGVDIPFTSDELARLQMQATFHGRELDVYITEMVMELRDRMLEKV